MINKKNYTNDESLVTEENYINDENYVHYKSQVNDHNNAYEKNDNDRDGQNHVIYEDEEYENYNFTDYTEFGETKTKHTSYS